MTIREKLVRCIDLFLYQYKEKYPEQDPRAHSVYGPFKLYIDSSDYSISENKCIPRAAYAYAELTFAGVAVNLNGKIETENPDFISIDYEKWANTALHILEGGNVETRIFQLKDFELKQIDEVKIKKHDLFADEYRVKANILDDLLGKNISFTNPQK